MADLITNIAAGRVNQYANMVIGNDPTAAVLTLVLLKTGDTDANFRAFDTLSALIAGASVEADFTNYARQTYTTANLSGALNVDDTANDQEFTLPAKTISSAGGATNNTLAAAILCYDPLGTDVDANMIPLIKFDATETTNGQDLVISSAIVARATPS